MMVIAVLVVIITDVRTICSMIMMALMLMMTIRFSEYIFVRNLDFKYTFTGFLRRRLAIMGI